MCVGGSFVVGKDVPLKRIYVAAGPRHAALFCERAVVDSLFWVSLWILRTLFKPLFIARTLFRSLFNCTLFKRTLSKSLLNVKDPLRTLLKSLLNSRTKY